MKRYRNFLLKCHDAQFLITFFHNARKNQTDTGNTETHYAELLGKCVQYN